MSGGGIMWCLLSFLCNLYLSETAKILMIPGNINSHLFYFSRLGEGLSKLGHTIELLAPSNANIPSHMANKNFTITSYKVNGEKPFVNSQETAEMLLQITFSNSLWTKFNAITQLIEKTEKEFYSDCVCLMEDRELIRRVQNDRFQFAIVDAVVPSCYILLPHSVGIPYAPLSVAWMAWTFRVPRMSSFVSSSSLGYSDEMTFKQRFLTFMEELLIYYTMPESKINFADKYFQNMPIRLRTANELLFNSSLWLYLEDSTVGYPYPNMPNTLSIGDIMAGQPEKPLPQHLETFISKTPDGAILVSFGSYFDYIPEFLAQGFCEAFRQVKYQVIWKLKNDSACGDAANVKILPWIPQNDLLAHPKIRLFITHGGINSLVESVYHAKPVIVFPIAVDQDGNAEIASTKGYGIRMDITKFSVEELLTNIDLIIQDPNFVGKAQLYSAIMKDKQTGPAERVSHMINHVIKYGDRHLRTGAFNLSAFQFFMFDIFLLILLLVGLVTLALFCCTVCLLRLAKRSVFKPRKIKNA